MEFVLVPPGEFGMGSPEDEPGHLPNEILHPVQITRPLYYGIYPVTQRQYEVVMGQNPSEPANLHPDKPVDHVTYDSACAFCQKLSERTGSILRLPTEAEWEYACRAGSQNTFTWGKAPSLREQYMGPRADTRISRPVGQKNPNHFGLYDIHGNIWEWVSDWYADAYDCTFPLLDPKGAPHSTGIRVFRGGHDFNSDHIIRCTFRHTVSPWFTDSAIGMRVVMERS